MRHKKPALDLIKNTAIIAAGKFSTQFLIFLLLPLYTSHLSTYDYGVVDLIITYTALFVPVLTVQQEFAVFRFLIDARKNEDKIKSIVSSGFFTILKIILVSSVLYLLALPFISIPFKYLILPNIVAVAFSNYFLQVARGIGKNALYSIACVLSGSITVLINLVLILIYGFGAESILVASITANLACSIFLLATLKLHHKISMNAAGKKLGRELIKYAIPIIFNGISWWVVSVSDRSVLAIFLSASASGIYAVANTFPSIINSLFYIFSMSWSESASLNVKSKTRDEFFSLIFNNAIRIFSALGSGLVACLPFIFPVFVRDNFATAYPYVPILVFGMLLSGFAGFYCAIYSAQKQTKNVMVTSVVAAIVNLVVDLALVKIIGIYAAAISTALAFFTMLIVRHIDLRKTIKLHIDTKILVMATTYFAMVCVAYYINTPVINVVILMLTILYAVLMNHKILKSIPALIKTKFKTS